MTSCPDTILSVEYNPHERFAYENECIEAHHVNCEEIDDYTINIKTIWRKYALCIKRVVTARSVRRRNIYVINTCMHEDWDGQIG